LNLRNNKLKFIELKNLPQLGSLDLSYNEFEKLDLSDFPSLGNLDLSNNNLKQINLTKLPALNSFTVSNNKLVSLELNNFQDVVSFDISNNPNLEYLYLKKIYGFGQLGAYNCTNLRYICTDSNLIDIIKYQLSFIPFLQIDTVCTSSSGGNFYTLKGQVKLDLNNNGCDEEDMTYPNLKIKINNASDSGYVISGLDGNFSIKLYSDTFTFTPEIENPEYFTVNPTSVTISLPDSVGPTFCITPNGVHKDLSVSIIPTRAARPGFSDATYKVVYKNQGTTTQNGSVTFNYDEAKMNFITSSPIADITTNGKVSFNFSGLAPFETRSAIITMRTNAPTDNPAVNSGDLLEFTAVINGLTDETPDDNLAILNQTVIGSFDPNDKTCLEGDIVSPELIGKNVHYLIRFENEGTANAENIVVTDYIDTTVFDINTLQITDASHICHTQISQENKVQFIFSDIQLPFTEPNKHGHVAFSIKLKDNLVIGDSIQNKADIYFDYNLPVATNNVISEINYKTITYIGRNNSIKAALDIYPNPSNGQFSLDLKADINSKVQISILNVEGKVVFAREINHQQHSLLPLNLKSLAKGVYLIKAQIENDIFSKKVVIQ
jgi:uncharacterized repeat protein (TIGR01451 family)